MPSQERQEEEPDDAANVPFAHGSQLACPDARCAVPGAQSSQAVEPNSAENVPTLQASQLDLPGSLWNRPASQSMQSLAPAWLNLPGGQSSHELIDEEEGDEGLVVGIGSRGIG